MLFRTCLSHAIGLPNRDICSFLIPFALSAEGAGPPTKMNMSFLPELQPFFLCVRSIFTSITFAFHPTYQNILSTSASRSTARSLCFSAFSSYCRLSFQSHSIDSRTSSIADYRSLLRTRALTHPYINNMDRNPIAWLVFIHHAITTYVVSSYTNEGWVCIPHHPPQPYYGSCFP